MCILPIGEVAHLLEMLAESHKLTRILTRVVCCGGQFLSLCTLLVISIQGVKVCHTRRGPQRVAILIDWNKGFNEAVDQLLYSLPPTCAKLQALDGMVT